MQMSLSRIVGVVVGCSAALTLVACGSETSSTPATSGSSSTSAAATPGVATNVAVTDEIRAELIAAGAAKRELQASDFTGLEPGKTFYAYDPATKTYWAGAALVPDQNAYNAMVSSQDNGAYTIFHKAEGGDWVALDVGMAGPNSAPGNYLCPTPPPADILVLWGWPAKSCHPNGI